MYKKPLILLTSIFIAVSAAAADNLFQKLFFERLPDMQTSRGCHQAALLNGEVTIFGGHTTGFNPAQTAEYYSGGSWHSIHMTWPHDGGCVAIMPDGRVFIAGGNAEAFGIGRSWGAEIFDPATHSFSPIGILDCNRTSFSSLALPDGQVIITGNWLGPDGIESYTTESGFKALKSLAPGFCYPYILRCSEQDVIIFSSMYSTGEDAPALAYRLNGAPVEVPLLGEWTPIFNWTVSDEEQKIADFTYLLLASRRDLSGSAILKVSSGEFSILELETPIPSEGPSGDHIFWTAGPQVDRSRRIAWIQGNDISGRIYFAKIGYNPTFDGGKASVELYYAETPEGFPLGKALLLPGGKLILTGGTAQAGGKSVIVNDNFNVFSSVYLFHTEEPSKEAVPVWMIIAGALLLCGILVPVVLRSRRKGSPQTDRAEEAEQTKKLDDGLMEEMKRLIEEKELFKRSDLRITDVASELATNRTYTSILVNNLTGSGFSDLINGYRIRYAQKLMLEHPEMVHGDIAIASGFASRTAFLRTFKAKTGLSPTEWKNNHAYKDIS